MTLQLFACHRLSASITREQCHKNRKVQGACVGCLGLSADPIGHVVQHVTPDEERAATEMPIVTLRFDSPEDRELYGVLKRVCSDLEYDIMSLLHLACRGDLTRIKGITKVHA